jgi:muramoyltetrapeptide carboxypeptidase LdcA involved in peptidoglycan recycling
VPHLRPGGHIRVIAPSRSLEVLSDDVESRALAALQGLGYSVSFGAHARESGFLSTAPAHARLADLHGAYADPAVDAILSVVGGYRCMDLLGGVDWDLLRARPKPLCGYSDISVLLNAVWRMTGTVTFCGPHFSSFAMKDNDGYQTKGFLAAVGRPAPVRLAPADQWSDDTWYLDGHERFLMPGTGWAALRPGSAIGRLIGGNSSSLLLLQATPYAPALEGTILLIEDTAAIPAGAIRRSLVALSLRPDFTGVRGLIFGRFQRETELDRTALGDLVATLPDAYHRIPILADVEAGHTQPIATFPIGGLVSMQAGSPNEIVLCPEESS